MTNRSKVTHFFAVLATGIFLVSGAANCQANDAGRAVVVEAVKAAGSQGDVGREINAQPNSDSDVGSARDADTADRSNDDIGSARDGQDGDEGDIGVAR